MAKVLSEMMGFEYSEEMDEMIIFNGRVSLMEEGVIKGTGNFITVENEDGEKVQLEEPEELHTYVG